MQAYHALDRARCSCAQVKTSTGGPIVSERERAPLDIDPGFSMLTARFYRSRTWSLSLTVEQLHNFCGDVRAFRLSTCVTARPSFALSEEDQRSRMYQSPKPECVNCVRTDPARLSGGVHPAKCQACKTCLDEGRPGRPTAPRAA